MCRLLILDDDVAYCSTLTKALQQSRQGIQFDVISTTDGEEAIRLAERSVEDGKPIHIFLIDDRLQGDLDGIAVWEQVHKIIPDAEGVIFTGLSDPERWSKAYAFGAAYFIVKPIQMPELYAVLTRLHRWQQERREIDWLHVINEIYHATERSLDFQEVTEIIVNGVLALGFERSRLYWFPHLEDGTQKVILKGIQMAGQDFVPEFKDHIFPNTSPYIKIASQTREVLFFIGRSNGPGLMEIEFGTDRYPPPQGEWVLVPIWAGDRFFGMLMLDNAEQGMQLSQFQKLGLGLLASMVSASLGRARLFGLEKRRREEIELINQIGRQITLHTNNLKKLLMEIRIQIGQMMDVSNFIIALVDEDGQKLDFRLHYENRKFVPRHFLSLDEGMTGYVVKERRRQSLYLPDGSEEHLHLHHIQPHGKPDKCWIGIPLWVEDRLIGVMIVQHLTQPRYYRPEDVHLLEAIAEQVAGAIHVALLTEGEQNKLEMMQRASADLMQLATENEDWMWKTLLNIISASYGLRFNRACLFLASKDNERLIGRAGVGQLDNQLARRDWERDLKVRIDYKKFLQYLRAGQLPITPIETLTQKLDIARDQNGGQNLFFQVLDTGKRMHLAERTLTHRLPSSFVTSIDPVECAIVPIKSGSKSIGLVVVDNKHDGKPILEEQLDHLETFLNLAGLAWESLHRGQRQEALLRASRTVTGQAGVGSLQSRLTQICQSARIVTSSDWAVIFPLKLAGQTQEYDTDNIAIDGDLSAHRKMFNDKPRQFGVSAHILRTGRLVIEDVQIYDKPIYGIRLANHPFIQREGFRSFIGLPLTDLETAVNLGIMYLDFHQAQKFTEEDLEIADTLAGLAANAIRTWHVEQQIRREPEEARRREQEILQNVHQEALSSIQARDVIKSLIAAVQKLLNRPDLPTWVAQKEIRPQPDGSVQSSIYYYAIQASETMEVEPPQGINEELAESVFKTGNVPLEIKNNYLVFPIRASERCLGLLVIENSDGSVTSNEISILERLASTGYLALDNVLRQQHLLNVLSAAQAITAPIELNETLNTIVHAAQGTFPGLDALTIWYVDSQSGRIKVGPSFGVEGLTEMEQEKPQKGTVVWNVMHSPTPIFAEDSRSNPLLANRFVYDENVQSTAALSLHSSGIDIGAIFFNYHSLHRFTLEEQTLFEVFAAIASANLFSGYRLEHLNTVLKMTEAIGTTLDSNQIISDALKKLSDLLSGDNIAPCLLIYNANSDQLEFTLASRSYYSVDVPEYRSRTKLLLSDKVIACEIAQQTITEHRVISRYIEDTSQDPNYVGLINSTQSILCISMVSTEGKLIGILMLESPNKGAFNKMEISLVEGIAREMAVAIERRKLVSRLRYKDAIASKMAWTADMAHDIKSTAGKIRQYAGMILEKNNVSKAIRSLVEKIDSHAARLKDFGTGRKQTSTEVIRIDDEVQAQVASLLRKSKLRVQFVFEGGCIGLTIKVNSLGLSRVLRHLVNNALEEIYGQGKLTVRTSRINDEWIEIQVEDNGGGFREDKRSSAFEEPMPTSKVEGSGYGLLYSRLAVEEMNGTIYLMDSEPGRGTVFCIRLPVDSPSTRITG